MTLEYALAKLKANDPEASAWLTGLAEKRFKELERKGWDWPSFYNGWIEGLNETINVLSEDGD